MGKTEKVELTVLVLLRRGREILLQNRTKADWKGYALPGGHVEFGESLVEAAVREIREETGLTILDPRLCGVKQFPIEGGRYLVFLFLADRFSGELRASSEGEMVWVPRDRLGAYPCVEDLAILLEMMEDPGKQEFQYILEEGSWKAHIR